MSFKELTQKEKDNLESLIDRHGLFPVLEAIAEICYLKADHLTTNWQDRVSARLWEKAGKWVEKAGAKTEL